MKLTTWEIVCQFLVTTVSLNVVVYVIDNYFSQLYSSISYINNIINKCYVYRIAYITFSVLLKHVKTGVCA